MFFKIKTKIDASETKKWRLIMRGTDSAEGGSHSPFKNFASQSPLACRQVVRTVKNRKEVFHLLGKLETRLG